MSEYIHGDNIANKLKNEKNAINKAYLSEIKKCYDNWRDALSKIKGDSLRAIKQRTALLNEYKNFIDQPKFRKEKGNPNGFTSQSKLHSTVLEEFMFHLLREIPQLKDKKLLYGPTNAYSNLYFAPNNLATFEHTSGITINTKNQDFAISKEVCIETTVTGAKYNEGKTVSVPIVSIECKTYLDKTMYEGSVATAEKIKRGNPYSLFLIVTETYEVGPDVDPNYSQIDQIYVLRKKSKSSLEERMSIQEDVVIDLYRMVAHHVASDWRNIENRLETGKMVS